MSGRQGLLAERAGFAAAVVEGRIVVLGGEVLSGSRRTLDSVEIFDPAQGRWQPGPALPVPLHGVPAVSVNARLYVLGGSDRRARSKIWVEFSPSHSLLECDFRSHPSRCCLS